MSVLRLLLTALLAAFAIMAGLFLAALVFFTGLVSALTQRFRRNPLPSRGGDAGAPPQHPKISTRR